ncbi:hypothetical protein D9619_003756 [Psilocybe cf. subviscida]|uniref:Uncharacterized protein n=1 Tax=Psilocybe cf. subviscida TaxID=2480587 RepID=A0A8H5EU27_9AGAR|nr:hypothetical protein D9619_003756 [Psilocybe cf. subviscida]
MLQPTATLPPIKFIRKQSPESLQAALTYLRSIYNPPVRGSRRRQTKKRDTHAADVDALRTDAFERSYTIKWLTALTSQCEASEEDEDYERLVEDAASLLAICAGTASAGVITRQFVFDLTDPGQASTVNPSVSVDLRDVPLDNHDYGSVGAQTWGGACIMAEMIAEDPQAFGLCLTNVRSGGPLRCLELGAGTGLVSLAAGKVVEQLSCAPDCVQIVATDYYPSVLTNLEENLQTNFPASSSPLEADSQSTSRPRITVRRLDWFNFSIGEEVPDPVLQEPFDVIYGADIIYEAQHATWIKGCLSKLLSRKGGVFHLIIPLRSTHAKESGTIETVFGDSSPGFLMIQHRATIVCDADAAEVGEEVEYAYYRIGWSDDATVAS